LQVLVEFEQFTIQHTTDF